MSDDLRRLSVDLGRAARAVDPRKMVEFEAVTVKRQWGESWGDLGDRLKHLGRSITYDTRVTMRGADADIGPDLDRLQGPLGGIVEEGTSAHGPIAPVTERLTREAGERMAAYLAAQAAKLL